MPPKLNLVCVISNFGATPYTAKNVCGREAGTFTQSYIHTYAVRRKVQEGEESILASNKEFHFAP